MCNSVKNATSEINSQDNTGSEIGRIIYLTNNAILLLKDISI